MRDSERKGEAERERQREAERGEIGRHRGV